MKIYINGKEHSHKNNKSISYHEVISLAFELDLRGTPPRKIEFGVSYNWDDPDSDIRRSGRIMFGNEVEPCSGMSFNAYLVPERFR